MKPSDMPTPEDYVHALKAEIERLRAENAALTHQWNMKQETCAELRKTVLDERARLAKVVAELERQRDHLPEHSVGRKRIDALLAKVAAAQPEEESRG